MRTTEGRCCERLRHESMHNLQGSPSSHHEDCSRNNLACIYLMVTTSQCH
jgi:hypothetical protein